MSVTDPVYEPHAYEPDKRSAFGPIVSAFEVEHAVAECVRVWIRDYLAELCRQRKLDAEAFPPFRSLVATSYFHKLPEDQLPALIITSPGTEASRGSARGGRMEIHGDGTYGLRWRVEAGAVVTTRGNREAAKLARFYTAAVRVLLTQQLPDPRWCPIDVRGVDCTGERYRVTDAAMERTQAAGSVDLIIDVENVGNRNLGPAAPMFEPTPPDVYPEAMLLPDVERTDVTVTNEAIVAEQ